MFPSQIPIRCIRVNCYWSFNTVFVAQETTLITFSCRFKLTCSFLFDFRRVLSCQTACILSLWLDWVLQPLLPLCCQTHDVGWCSGNEAYLDSVQNTFILFILSVLTLILGSISASEPSSYITSSPMNFFLHCRKTARLWMQTLHLYTALMSTRWYRRWYLLPLTRMEQHGLEALMHSR